MKKNETLIEKACANIPAFNLQYKKLKRSVELAVKSQSTPSSYLTEIQKRNIQIISNTHRITPRWISSTPPLG
jgi:hypothetical protein